MDPPGNEYKPSLRPTTQIQNMESSSEPMYCFDPINVKSEVTSESTCEPCDTAPTTTNDTTTFKGVRMTSHQGGKTVLVYKTPGTNFSYSFQLHKVNKYCDTYSCSRCKTHRKHLAVKVIGDDFLDDPSLLKHVCTPLNAAAEEAMRIGYKVTQTLRTQNDPTVLQKPKKVYLDVMSAIKNSDMTDRLLVAEEWAKSGMKMKRSSFSKAINRQRKDNQKTPYVKEPKLKEPTIKLKQEDKSRKIHEESRTEQEESWNVHEESRKTHEESRKIREESQKSHDELREEQVESQKQQGELWKIHEELRKAQEEAQKELTRKRALEMLQLVAKKEQERRKVVEEKMKLFAEKISLCTVTDDEINVFLLNT